jgi:hypothetical protein
MDMSSEPRRSCRRLTDVEADEGGHELLNSKRVERQRRSDDTLPIVAPRVASEREELHQDGNGSSASANVFCDRSEETDLDEL